jgi:uncharacterized RDD family membrane protein YckC
MFSYEVSTGGAMMIMAIFLALIILGPFLANVASEVVPDGSSATMSTISKAVFPFSGLFPGIGTGISIGMWVIVVFLFSYFAKGVKFWQATLAAVVTIAVVTYVLQWTFKVIGVKFAVL